MDALEAIFKRRSIRRFTDQPISDEIVEQLLRAAMAAPSAHNEQPWHFVTINDRTILEKITEVHPYAQMLKEAPLAICVCGDKSLENDPGVDYWVQDCSAATENILIAATALGLGSCWLGILLRPERMEALTQLL
ncbi:MAG: nitroreductase family protein, partial [Sedimentisphaerales bacterium]|nr:nitroreductase family protein [Sedimentisphaerales bacterium]